MAETASKRPGEGENVGKSETGVSGDRARGRRALEESG